MTKFKITAAVVAAHLDMTRQRVGQLVDEDVLARLPDGSFGLDDCRVRYVRWLRRTDGRAAKAEVDRRWRDLKADELELRIEERSKNLIKEAQEEALQICDEFGGLLKSDLMALPARLTNDLVLRRRIEDAISQAFNDAAKRAAKAAVMVKSDA